MPQPRALIAAALAVPLVMTAALAAEPPAPDQSKQPMVCRGGQKTVGSRTRTPRRCRSAVAWQLDDDKADRLPVGSQVTPGQNDGRPPPPPR